MNIWLIVGLGNPGNEYAFTRHNIGFILLDYWAHSLSLGKWSNESKALTLKTKLSQQQIILVKPQTFMNKSGESVQPLLHFYKIPLDHLLVVQDDIDQAFNKMRFHFNRGHGGHNGIKSISGLLGNNEYSRLKLGVGRPSFADQSVADYVLQDFSKEEAAVLPSYLDRGCDAITCFINEGLNKASTQFNQ